MLNDVTIATDDGHRFHCTVETLGKEDPKHFWVFSEGDRRYIGPPWLEEPQLWELRALVREWWDGKKALGQDGLDVEVMQARIARDMG